MIKESIIINHGTLKLIDTNLIKAVATEMSHLSISLETAIDSGISINSDQIDFLCAKISTLNSLSTQLQEWRKKYNSSETIEANHPDNA